MPLARGTAAVGYTTMLGLFWAAGMPISKEIPKDYQVGGVWKWNSTWIIWISTWIMLYYIC
jgi:hypothetical protein